MALETLIIYLERLRRRVYLNIPACMTVFNHLKRGRLFHSKREIVSLFFLTTKFLSFSIQDNNKQDFRREKRNRVILACWLAGLSCKPTPFKSKRKKFNRDFDIGSQKICFILSHILNVQINERI